MRKLLQQPCACASSSNITLHFLRNCYTSSPVRLYCPQEAKGGGGAASGDRTHTLKSAADFESASSTSSGMAAYCAPPRIRIETSSILNRFPLPVGIVEHIRIRPQEPNPKAIGGFFTDANLKFLSSEAHNLTSCEVTWK